jgi:pilus assembly protein CpaD
MHMSRTKFAAALAVAGLTVAGCSGSPEQVNTSLYSVNQPVVQRTDFVIDLATSGGGISVQEQARLGAWFQSLQLGYGDRVAIDEPRGYEDPQARRAVMDVASSYGLLVVDGAPMTAGAVQPGSVRVVVSRTTASVPSCPNWGSAMETGPLQTSPNYGCAVNGNLAAMVADPNDLVLGQTGAPGGDPVTAARAIRVYRNATPTGNGGLPTVSTRQGGN